MRGTSGYPSDWAEIARRVKERAGWRCEHCGHPHDPASGHTLTVHHLDGNPANCAEDNLVALCQRCHLHVQATFRPGQMILPGMTTPPWYARVYGLLKDENGRSHPRTKGTHEAVTRSQPDQPDSGGMSP